MEWLDFADCAGDDPLKWDLDHVDADDVQSYAQSVCGDCPVRRECAAHAIDDRPEVGRVVQEVVAEANLAASASERVEVEGAGDARQVGVIRGGVALVGKYERALYRAAGRRWHGFGECDLCGRVSVPGRLPREMVPEGAVVGGTVNRCSSCRGSGGRRKDSGASARQIEAVELRRLGFTAAEVANRLGVSTRSVDRYWKAARESA